MSPALFPVLHAEQAATIATTSQREDKEHTIDYLKDDVDSEVILVPVSQVLQAVSLEQVEAVAHECKRCEVYWQDEDHMTDLEQGSAKTEQHEQREGNGLIEVDLGVQV